MATDGHAYRLGGAAPDRSDLVSCHSKSVRAASLCRRLVVFPQAPELKTLRIDRLLNRITGKPVRRSAIRRDDTGRSPWAMLLGQLAAAGVADKSMQCLSGFRLKYINAHDLILSQTLELLGGYRMQPQMTLLVRLVQRRRNWPRAGGR